MKNITKKDGYFYESGAGSQIRVFSEFMDPDCPARWLLSDSLIKSAVCIP